MKIVDINTKKKQEEIQQEAEDKASLLEFLSMLTTEVQEGRITTIGIVMGTPDGSTSGYYHIEYGHEDHLLAGIQRLNKIVLEVDSSDEG